MENINPNQCQKTEYECPKTNPEEVGLKFDKCQRHKLAELINQAGKNQDGTPIADEDKDYTEVYKFIQDQLPDDKDKTADQKALDVWLDVAISTNNNSSDIVDVSLRNITKATLKRTLGDDYKEQYKNEAKFYEQYKKISNQTGKKITDDLVNGCKIDTDYIVHLDAYNFRKFDKKFETDPENSRIQEGDSPVAPVDKDLFGKDYVKETAGASEDRIEGNLDTSYSHIRDKKVTPWNDKITPPTTATSKATEEFILSQKNKM